MEQLSFDFMRGQKKEDRKMNTDFVWGFLKNQVEKFCGKMRDDVKNKDMEALSRSFILLGISVTMGGVLLEAPDLMTNREVLEQSAQIAFSNLIKFSRIASRDALLQESSKKKEGR